jgi:hypothetical protein
MTPVFSILTSILHTNLAVYIETSRTGGFIWALPKSSPPRDTEGFQWLKAFFVLLQSKDAPLTS